MNSGDRPFPGPHENGLTASKSTHLKARGNPGGKEITMDDTSKAERIRQLLKADRDGRLVVLPCNVGDVVYGFHGEKTILPMVAK